MAEPEEFSPSKTMRKRIAQYQDRWTSFGAHTGVLWLSEKLSPDELRELELFESYDDAFLEKLSPDISVAIWEEGAVLFEEGSYLDLAFFVVSGEIEVFVQKTQVSGTRPIFDNSRAFLTDAGGEQAPSEKTVMIRRDEVDKVERRRPSRGRHEITLLSAMDFDLPRGASTRLGVGELFGEIGALGGWPQSVTARAASECRLVQIRVPALRLMRRKSKALKERLDELYRSRSLVAQLETTPLFEDVPPYVLERLRDEVDLVSLDPEEIIVQQGEPVDALYLVRSGFVKLLSSFGDGDLLVSYLSKGMTLGETELMIEEVGSWRTTAAAVEYAELVKIPRAAFDELLRKDPEVAERLWRSAAAQVREVGAAQRNIAHSEVLQMSLDTGLVQGSSVLVIDLDTCTRCDDCVRGCATTHGGRPRFVREGDKVDNLLIAKSCYHCRDPVCLVGCPTGAIHRAGVGDVVSIEDEICIGCASCANNCPYDAIVMHDLGESWPDDMIPTGLRGRDRKLASKCDLCIETSHDPACVSNCPQGCAYRVGTLEEFEALLRPREVD